MNTEFAIHDPKVIRAGQETLAEARSTLPGDFPKRSARRMTHLGTLMARVLAGRDPGSTLIYGTTYAETRSLEDYVDSFPNPSPLLFQGSIHPSGIQQVFVHRKIPIGPFIPITGGEHLIASVLETALLAVEGRITVCGGEEKGTWLLEQDKASPSAFGWAFALEARDPDGVGRLSVVNEATDTRPEAIGHEEFVCALERRTPLEVRRPRGGFFRIRWV